jgi:hypothetical protein
VKKQVFIHFFIYVAGAKPSPLLLRPFIGLLCQSRMIGGDDCAEIGGMDERQENPPQCRCVRHRSHMTWRGLGRGALQWEAGH